LKFSSAKQLKNGIILLQNFVICTGDTIFVLAMTPVAIDQGFDAAEQVTQLKPVTKATLQTRPKKTQG
jgi:hypothetical protein